MGSNLNLLISNFYYDLKLLLDPTGKYYFVALDEFINSSYNIFDINYLMNIDPKNEYSSLSTKCRYEEFRIHWVGYLKDNNYSEDGIFIQFDPKWSFIKEHYLIPLLIDLENEMLRLDINFQTFRDTYNSDARPSDEDILERGRTLYGLLLKHKVIKRDYMDEKS